MDRLSIIIPALNEAQVITGTLAALQPVRACGHEVIVADGGSLDGTVRLAEPLADRVLVTARGRARQMNAGAAIARGDVLWFLHADTLPAQGADRLLIDGMRESRRGWGRFDVRLSGRRPLLRVVEYLMNQRSRLTGIATGDQGIFVQRELFNAIGGFPDIALMEDIAMSRLLRRHGPPLCLSVPVMTSSRRWEEHGVLRTVFLMWGLRLAYAMGIAAAQLARFYRYGTRGSCAETDGECGREQRER